MSVEFDPASWVASFVFTWPQASQDALLGHEQTHYLIAALSGRDFFNDLMAVYRRDYATSADVVADVRNVQGKYTHALIQGIQDKYDLDTHHDPVGNVMAQTIWNGVVSRCQTLNLPLRDTLERATLIPPIP
jgi:hypothetical protein